MLSALESPVVPGNVVKAGNAYFLCVKRNQFQQIRASGFGSTYGIDDLESPSVVGSVDLGDIQDAADVKALYQQLIESASKPTPTAPIAASPIDLSGLAPYIPYGSKIASFVVSGKDGEARSKHGISEIVHGKSPGAVNIGSGQVIVAPGGRYAVWSDAKTTPENPEIARVTAGWKTQPVTSLHVDKKEVLVNGEWMFPVDSTAPCFASVQGRGPIQVFLIPNHDTRILLFRAGDAIAFVGSAKTKKQIEEEREADRKRLDEEFRRVAELHRQVEQARYAEDEKRWAEERKREEEKRVQDERRDAIRALLYQVDAWEAQTMKREGLRPGTAAYKRHADDMIDSLALRLAQYGLDKHGNPLPQNKIDAALNLNKAMEERNRKKEIEFRLAEIDAWRSGAKASPGQSPNSERYALSMRERIKEHAKRLNELGCPISEDGLTGTEAEPEEGADIYTAHIQTPTERIDLDVGLSLADEEDCIRSGCTFVVYAQTAEDKGELLKFGMTATSATSARAVIRPGDAAGFKKIYGGLRRLGVV